MTIQNYNANEKNRAKMVRKWSKFYSYIFAIVQLKWPLMYPFPLFPVLVWKLHKTALQKVDAKKKEGIEQLPLSPLFYC